MTDDDLSGTFAFLRALEDYGYPAEIAPAQIGQTWLNYILPLRTVLWWGGVGNSTEHTAYLNLRDGIVAPESGSMARNGKVVAEQIGAQIFVDGWAMIAPGDPERAAELARRAASVSHDGEAIYGAQALVAMEALAFVEHDMGRLLDAAVRAIPTDSVIARLYGDLREWHAADGDWHRTRERIVERYGYHIYGGNCHIVPNHALILLGLLYGADDMPPTLLPAEPTLSNYAEALALLPPGQQPLSDIPAGLTNSLAIALASTAVMLVVGAMAGYAFARLRFPGRRILLITLLSLRMLPGVVLAVPLFLLATLTHLFDTRLALVIVYSAFNLPFAVWLLTVFFQEVPRDLEDVE